MLENIGGLTTTGILVLAIWVMMDRSPARVIHKVLGKTPKKHTQDDKPS